MVIIRHFRNSLPNFFSMESLDIPGISPFQSTSDYNITQSPNVRTPALSPRKDEISHYHDHRDFIGLLRQKFKKVDTDNKGTLTIDQWMSSDIRSLIREGTLSMDEFKKYFWRIDANCEGFITWNELVEYLMKEISHTELHMNEQTAQFVQKTSKVVPREFTHREMVKQIAIVESNNE